MNHPLCCSFLLLILSAPAAAEEQAAAAARLPSAEPAAVGMNADRLDEIDQIAREGIDAGEMPGCVVLVARRGKAVFLKAYGDRRIQPAREPMTADTVFDLASLTKPVATAASVMLLVERGDLSLDDPVAKHLPEFAANGKDAITVLHLLTHQGGLIADNPLADYEQRRDESMKRVFALKPLAAPGEKFIYSDVGFIVLGEMVTRVSGKPLDEFVRDNLFAPLGMAETGYLPPESLRRRAAPTEQRDGEWMTGEVHDPRAHRLGGVAGHAGLFSTAEDLAVFAEMLHGRGEFQGRRVMRPETVAAMVEPRQTPRGLRGCGWDVQSPYSSNRGEGMSSRAVGHGGFTGTAMWIDAELELTVIFLSNRLHPDGEGSVNRLAGRIGGVAVAAIGSQ